MGVDEGPWPGGGWIGGTATHWIAREDDAVHVVARGGEAPPWTLPGRWSIVDAGVAAADAILLIEDAGESAPGRYLLLRP